MQKTTFSNQEKKGISTVTLIAVIVIVAVSVGALTYIYARPQPEFQVKSLSLSSNEVAKGENIKARVEVTNTVDAEVDYTVEVEVGEEKLTKDVALDAGESRTISFDIEKEVKGTYYLNVEGLSEDFEVVAPAEFELSNLDLSKEEVKQDETVTVTVDVSNTGELSGTHTVEMLVNDESVDSQEVEVESGNTETVAFDISREEPGTYEINISDLNQSFVVLEPAEFELNNLTISPENVAPEETVNVSVGVRNVGGTQGAHKVELEVDGTVENTRNVTLEGGETTTVTFSITREPPESYSVGVGNLSDSFNILKPAEFEVSNLTLNPSKVSPGEDVNVSVEVQNVGDLSGDYEVELQVEGDTENSQTVALDGGKSTNVSFTIRKKTKKFYSVGIDNLTQDFEVVAPAEFVVENLTISKEIFVGEPFTASVDVRNIGGIEGTFEGALKIDGSSVDTKEIDVRSNETQELRFEVSVNKVGSYNVGISNCSEQFYAWSFDLTKIGTGSSFDSESGEIISSTEFKQGDIIWTHGEVNFCVDSLSFKDFVRVYNPNRNIIWEEDSEGKYDYTSIFFDESFVLPVDAPTGTYEIVYGGTNTKTGKTKTISSTFEVDRLSDESPITRNFSWEDHLGEEWTWDNFGIEQSRYEFYCDQSHSAYTSSDYLEFVTYENGLIVDMASQLKEKYSDSEDLANLILSFVQSFPYREEEEEYIRHPVETLVERGDCEDTAILCAAIMRAAGLEVSLIDLEGHMLMGVNLPEEPEYGTQDHIYWWEKDGKRFYTCETTGEGWNVGDLPEEYQDKSAQVMIVN